MKPKCDFCKKEIDTTITNDFIREYFATENTPGDIYNYDFTYCSPECFINNYKKEETDFEKIKNILIKRNIKFDELYHVSYKYIILNRIQICFDKISGNINDYYIEPE
jgi:hypothetical protein